MSGREDHVAGLLRAGLDDDPVDAASLLVGARQGARRIRRRRRIVTSAAVAVLVVAAVPVATGLLPDRQGPAPASDGATGPTPSGPPTAVLVPPSPAASTSLPLETAPDGSVVVPTGAMLGPGDLPAGFSEVDDGGPRRDLASLTTSICSEPAVPGDDLAAGGRQLFYPGPAPEGIATTVRLFEGEGATAQMAYLAEAFERCRTDVRDWVVQPSDSLPGDDAVLALVEDFTEPGVTHVVGGLRVGGVIVGVSLTTRAGAEQAVGTERDLLASAYERLVASGLPDTYPG